MSPKPRSSATMTRMLGLADFAGSTACSIPKGPSSNEVRARSEGFMVPVFPQGKFPGDAAHLRLQSLMLTFHSAISSIVPEGATESNFRRGLTRKIYKATWSDPGYVGLTDRSSVRKTGDRVHLSLD